MQSNSDVWKCIVEERYLHYIIYMSDLYISDLILTSHAVYTLVNQKDEKLSGKMNSM